MDLFETFINQAVEDATTCLFTDHAAAQSDTPLPHDSERSTSSVVEPFPSLPKLTAEHVDVYTTLAGFYITKMLACSGCVSGSWSSLLLSGPKVDVEQYGRSVEDLLKKAEMVLQAIAAETQQQQQTLLRHAIKGKGNVDYLTRVSTSVNQPGETSSLMPESSQQFSPSRRFSILSSGDVAPRPASNPNSPLLWYGYLYLAFCSSMCPSVCTAKGDLVLCTLLFFSTTFFRL